MSDQETNTNGTSSTAATNAQPAGLDSFATSFPDAPGSIYPTNSVLLDAAGNLFGVTAGGGTTSRGTVYEAPANPTGGQQGPETLTSFSNYYKGTAAAALNPGHLIMNSSGDLLGTTEAGGPNRRSAGTIFELTPSTTSATGYEANPNVLVSFKTRTGSGPENLTTNAVGNLFGTTTTGLRGRTGGTVFEVYKTRNGYQSRQHVLASFKGGEKVSSNLEITPTGIVGAVSGGAAGTGEIFELKATPRGTFQRTPTILAKDVSVQSLSTDSTGDLFAVSSAGGTYHQGAVYELNKTSTGYSSPTTLATFSGQNGAGADPTGVTVDSSGNVYGTTYLGGANGDGTVYEIGKTSTGYNAAPTTLQSFTGNSGSFLGANPTGKPTLDDGFLYGSTKYGGSGEGVVYGLNTAAYGGSTAAGSAIPATFIPASEGVPATHTNSALISDAVDAPAVTTAAAVCFAGGTRIRTTTGDMPVEMLAIGDRVVTASGAERLIQWVGHRTVDCRRHPRPHEVLPVRIAAHAFAPGKPARDLWVSPGHSVCLDVMGEVLIPAASLVNGTTVTQIEVERVTYWHVELEAHDIVLAEGLPSESYLEMGNRRFFAESGVVTLAASPDAAPARTHADFCRPFHADGPVVDVARATLGARVEAACRVDSVTDERLAS